MKPLLLCFFSLLVLPFPGSAGVVLYTTADNPPANTGGADEIVYLDASETLTDAWFAGQGIVLSTGNSAKIAQALQSPQWQTQEAKLQQAYQGVIRAWQLGVERIPAVVVDDKWVVYGITDIDRARSEVELYRQQHEEGEGRK
ncbi:TIGR03757 family integrating conjugative element protein [Providencia rettgeri]|uniref:TIGR03757 family integrating conjugative element protein n=1 Tax=Providencia rettgeri TaxID=587 RepID=UPI0024AC7BFD